MKWLADENIPSLAIERLRESGCDVLAIRDTSPMATDESVVALARSDDRIPLSFDRDHGDLIFNRRLSPPPAVVYVRIFQATPEALSALLIQVQRLGEATLSGQFTVVPGEGIRQRPLP